MFALNLQPMKNFLLLLKVHLLIGDHSQTPTFAKGQKKLYFWSWITRKNPQLKACCYSFNLLKTN
jgi:hypothetical protein